MHPKRPVFRSIQIAVALVAFAWAWFRMRRREPQKLPARFRTTLEGLGTTFVKLGQGLSLRRDILPPGYREELENLHSHVPSFDPDIAVATIEAAFGKTIAELFAEFERIPFAAASVAQVHRARMHDGTDVAVKVRRPGIERQVVSDLRLLRVLIRVAQLIVPALRRQRPVSLVNELGRQLRSEIDFEHEAKNMRRLKAVIDRNPDLTMPHVVEPYVAVDVLLLEFSHGAPLETAFGTELGKTVANLVLEAYLQQLLVIGVFHGDPHPGNLFVMSDGRVCFHDFGNIGYLDPAARRSLALLIESVSYSDAEHALDAALSLGFLTAPINRHEYSRSVSEILDELSTLPLSQWSVAETIWKISRLGGGESFRLPQHLLVLMRTLFLAENTIRALDPTFDLLAALERHRGSISSGLSGSRSMETKRPFGQRVTRTADSISTLLADMFRQAQNEDGRPSVSIYHRGLEELELQFSRTGNRLSLAMITLGLYIAGSLLMLHSAGPRIWGDVPVLAVVAFVIAGLLSLRLVLAIVRSGRL